MVFIKVTLFTITVVIHRKIVVQLYLDKQFTIYQLFNINLYGNSQVLYKSSIDISCLS